MPTIFGKKVVLNGLAFNDPASKPNGAQYWNLDVFDGWTNSPEMRVASTELGGYRDGEEFGDTFPLQARQMIVGGYVLASTAAEAEDMHDLLLDSAVPRNKDLEVVRYDSVPKMVTARRTGAFEVEWPLANGFRWQTTLTAPDPLRYALTESFGTAGVAGVSTSGRTYPRVYPVLYDEGAGVVDEGNQVIIVNEGTAPTYPTAELTGLLSAGQWRLSNETTGKELRMDVTVPNGSTLYLDFKRQTATLSGYPVNATVNGEFWSIVTGSNVIKLYAEEAAGAGFTIRAKSAWE